MKLVVIESPYAGDVERNKRYLQRCILDCLKRGESPYASHQMLTEALCDAIPEDRAFGIHAGFAWAPAADLIVFYVDYGTSAGMQKAHDWHVAEGRDNIEFRCIGENEQ